MTKIESIEKEVRGLTDTELAAFRKWVLEFDAEAWDRQIERDSASGRLMRPRYVERASHDYCRPCASYATTLRRESLA